ncbi:mercuric transport protein periplasmic component [Oceanisphaera arctica]|uniref:Periplasmic mercury ion-binding protein n=2 Tax=Oceanisphaera arctica TaxID=641510 RepID=A0A2P5THZ1_9GAMM|nr:mercury resistance system periplasmic binding protein MerP [Oceanisphaera arctica]PPL14208.1 mercuric transport protein periplasmic component [Oceanisphaera arctica]
MKNLLIYPPLLTAVFSLSAWSAEQTVTLSVPGMNCAACPITVKVALKKVEGVKNVDINYQLREARVTFEDSQASITELTEATTHAGYPSIRKE